MTAVVLVIVLLTKFLAGAWIAILAMIVFFVIMKAHPPALRQRRARSWPPTRRTRSCPTRVHAIVLVSKLHKPTLRALAFAKATRPERARGASTSPPTPRRPTGCCEEWDERNLGVPLKVLYSPYREIDPADRRLRHRDPAGQPARRGRGLHPGVRRRPLVGAAAAQPDRAAAQGPAAVHARA